MENIKQYRWVSLIGCFILGISSTGSASAAFAILSNDSIVSATASVETHHPATFELLDSDSAADSTSLTGLTTVPVDFLGAASATASAIDIDSFTETTTADANLDLDIFQIGGVVSMNGIGSAIIGNSISGGASWGDATAQALVDVTFSLDATYNVDYTLVGNRCCGTSTNNFQLLNLSDPATIFEHLGAGELTLVSSAVLGAGTYRFIAEAIADDTTSFPFGSTEMQHLLEFTPVAVPVPGAALLFVSGLLGLAGMVRRRGK